MEAQQMLAELRAEHDRVFEVLAEVDQLLDGPALPSVALRQRVLGLRYAVLSYTDIEDDLMPEVLRTLGVWGGDSSVATEREHARRRETLARALEVLDELPVRVGADDPRAIRALLARLSDEIRGVLTEEDQLLHEATARDESSRNDGFGG